MTLAAYNGHEALTFPDYLDLESGKTLHAEPRVAPYDIAPASGRTVPDIPEGWFTPAGQQDEDGGAAAEGDAAAPGPGSRKKVAGESAHDDDPDSEDEHSAL